MYLGFLGLINDGHAVAILVGPYVLGVALLMVSRIPTFSGKTMGSRIPREMVLPVLGLCAFAVLMLIGYPWHVLTTAAIAYLALIPFSMRAYRRHKAEDLAAQESRES